MKTTSQGSSLRSRSAASPLSTTKSSVVKRLASITLLIISREALLSSTTRTRLTSRMRSTLRKICRSSRSSSGFCMNSYGSMPRSVRSAASSGPSPITTTSGFAPTRRASDTARGPLMSGMWKSTNETSNAPRRSASQVSAPFAVSTMATPGAIVETSADMTRRVTAESSAIRTRKSSGRGAASAAAAKSSVRASPARMIQRRCAAPRPPRRASHERDVEKSDVEHAGGLLLGRRRGRRRIGAARIGGGRFGEPLAGLLRLGLVVGRQRVHEIRPPEVEGGMEREVEIPDVERLLQQRDDAELPHRLILTPPLHQHDPGHGRDLRRLAGELEAVEPRQIAIDQRDVVEARPHQLQRLLAVLRLVDLGREAAFAEHAPDEPASRERAVGEEQAERRRHAPEGLDHVRHVRRIERRAQELVGAKLERKLNPFRQRRRGHHDAERPHLASDRPGECLGSGHPRELQVDEGELRTPPEKEIARLEAVRRPDHPDRRVELVDHGRKLRPEIERLVGDERGPPALVRYRFGRPFSFWHGDPGRRQRVTGR